MDLHISERLQVIKPERRGYPYCYSLLVKGKESALIDPGAGVHSLQQACPGGVDRVLISHFHFDHLHGYVQFPRASFLVGEEEKETYLSPEVNLRHHGYDRWNEVMDVPRPHYPTPVGEEYGIPVRPGFQMIPVQETFTEGKTIQLGGISIVALHIPGHTMGHYAFYFPEEEVVFSADIDLSRMGPWYGNTFSNVGDFLHSIERLQALPFRCLVSAHRSPLETREALKGLQEFKAILMARNEAVLNYLNTPHTLNEIADQKFIGKQHENSYQLFWERVMVGKHLQYLKEQGLVAEQETGIYYRL